MWCIQEFSRCFYPTIYLIWFMNIIFYELNTFQMYRLFTKKWFIFMGIKLTWPKGRSRYTAKQNFRHLAQLLAELLDSLTYVNCLLFLSIITYCWLVETFLCHGLKLVWTTLQSDPCWTSVDGDRPAASTTRSITANSN